MEYLKALILGIVQGLTEWLPISSTAHLLIIDEFIKLSGSESFKSLFMVIIQLGSILAVVVAYFSTLWPFKSNKEDTKKSFELWFKIVAASIPAMVFGLLLDDIIDQKLGTWYVIAFTLAFYGILYVILEKRKDKKAPKYVEIEDISYKKAFQIGLFQALAIIPGTSRSGSTILGGMLLGFSRELAAKFSFFMAIPVMLGATAVRFIKHAGGISQSEWIMILFGTAVSFVVSLAVIKAFVAYVRRHDFSVFGIYRIIVAILLVLVFAF